LVLHREEGESEVVLQPDVSALSRISWNWTSLARRNGPASYERLRFKVKFPVTRNNIVAGGFESSVRFSRKQVCAPDPEFFQNKKTRLR